MAKLFPPIIDITIPAFYAEDDSIKISIPYQMNRGVSSREIKGFIVKVKAVQSSNYLFDQEIILNDSSLYESQVINFIVNENYKKYFNIGQYYKFQIAYIGLNGDIGYYSTVGIGKYTSKPSIYIEGLEPNKSNSSSMTYIGVYENQDVSEKVYSYVFNILDANGTILYTSGEKIHNSNEDIQLGVSTDIYNFNKEFESNDIYYIQYRLETINKIVLQTPKYQITKKPQTIIKYNLDFQAKLNYNNGYVSLTFNDKDNTSVFGNFTISRANKKDNYKLWEKITDINLEKQLWNEVVLKDFTIEQGNYYKYSIQQYNVEYIYSEKIYSNEIYADFEDAFLFDGEKQLKIRFNPKINNFKEDVLESKTDTIGSKYPFIIRNGIVNYKEFSISGLISYFSDEEELFTDFNSLTNNNEKYYNELSWKERKNTWDEYDKSIFTGTTNLTNENYLVERRFKLKVLDWLNDGKIKLFRSPSEGNYMVRLMNVSLTPLDQLGRLLHTFNCQAYEMEEFTHDTLLKYGYVNEVFPQNNYEIVFDYTTLDKFDKSTGLINSKPTNKIELKNLLPGIYFYLVNNNSLSIDDPDLLQNYKIQIGQSGSFNYESSEYNLRLLLDLKNNNLDQIKESLSNSVLFYSYSQKMTDDFSELIDYDIVNVGIEQAIGECDIFEKIIKFQYYAVGHENDDVLASQQLKRNVKLDIDNLKFFYLKGEKRQIIYSENKEFNNTYTTDICAIGHSLLPQNNKGRLYTKDLITNKYFELDKYYDLFNKKDLEELEYKVKYSTNNNKDIIIDLEFGRPYFNSKFDNLTGIFNSNGVVLYYGYQIGVKTYNFESDDNDIINAYQNYKNSPTRKNYNIYLSRVYDKYYKIHPQIDKIKHAVLGKCILGEMALGQEEEV